VLLRHNLLVVKAAGEGGHHASEQDCESDILHELESKKLFNSQPRFHYCPPLSVLRIVAGVVGTGDVGTLISPLIMSCIDISRASTLVDIWFTKLKQKRPISSKHRLNLRAI